MAIYTRQVSALNGAKNLCSIHRLRRTDIAGLRVEPDRFADPAQPPVVVPGIVSAGNVLEVYKAENGGKVFIDELYWLASNLLLSSFKRAIQKCI